METDAQLVCGIKARDEKALEQLIDIYGGLIKAIVTRHLTCIPNHCEECINDVLFSVWNNIDKFDPCKNSLKNWIGAICKYKCIDYKRKYYKELCTEEIDPNTVSDCDADKHVIQTETMQEIISLLNCLKPRDRKLFYRRYIMSESVEEIARSSGQDPSTLYNRLSRGRKRLRIHLQKKGDIYEK